MGSGVRRLLSDVELFEKARWDGLEMRIAMNEGGILDRGGCGNEGVHCGEAFLAGLPDFPRTRGGDIREGLDGDYVRNIIPI